MCDLRITYGAIPIDAQQNSKQQVKDEKEKCINFSDRNLVYNYWVTCDSSRNKPTDSVCLFSYMWQKKLNHRIQGFGIPP